MRSNFTIKIKKRTHPEFLLWLIVIMPFAFGTLFELLKLPSLFKYMLDVAWILLLAMALLHFKTSEAVTKSNKLLWMWVIGFFVGTLILYVLNYQSIFYYLWGVRNNFRFYVAFFACIMFLKKDDVAYYLGLFDKLFWINSIVCLIQYFGFGLYGDFLGGLFGAERGCNGYTNIFFVIIAIKSIVFYLNKQESLWYCIAKCGTIMVIAALAELKFFYIEFVLIVVMAVLLTKFSWRKLLVIVVGLFGAIFGIQLLIGLFSHSSDIFSLQNLIEIATADAGYSSSGDLNRLTAIPIISKNILTTNLEKVFGLGLGNCDSAGFDFLITPFSVRYAYLRYSWFSTAFTFLETGYFGLVFFFGFFILVFLLGRKAAQQTIQDKMYCQISAILAMSCILIAIYNSSLRTEAGYMVYVVLSFPFVIHNVKGSAEIGGSNET